ncbi:MAG: type II toxin-antitoxin system VapC family toxin [Methylovulum sp.]|nr:MAG: type II toxin-antitoxin system VapC family toxin [Methylovulum sp.]
MPTRKSLYYWDSPIFISWLQDEKRKPGEMEGVFELATKFEKKEIVLITSVVTLTEVLETRISPQAAKIFERFFKRRRAVLINLDPRIASLAGSIRAYYLQKGKQLSTPDSQHLATAIQHKVDELHTFDEDDLLPLNGNVANHPLVICKPHAPQLRFEGM